MFTLLKIVCLCSLALSAFAEEKKVENKKEAQSRSWIVDEPWRPVARWNPYTRQPLYTWWAAPWTANHHHHESLIHHPIPIHHEPHYPVLPIHHGLHHPIHHDPHHHVEVIPGPIGAHPVPAPIPYHNQHHQAKYVAQTLGSIHVAPLLGHTDSVVSTNLHPAPGRLLK